MSVPCVQSTTTQPSPIETLSKLGVQLKHNLFPQSLYPSVDLLFKHVLSCDLKIIALPLLPTLDSTDSRKQLGLTGILVQLEESPVNVSVSSFERKLSNINPIHGPGHRRMLRFVLTDGSKQVLALEYQPIPQLDSRTKAGVKILLKSNEVEVCKGMLLLTNTNCRVLEESGIK